MINIDKAVGEQLIKENESHNRPRQVGEYYAGDLGNCSRQLWYKYKDIDLESLKGEALVEKLKIFERGNLLHEWLTKRLRKAVDEDERRGILQEEVSVVIPNLQEQLVIRGRIDNLIRWEDGECEIIEVKTTARIPSPRGRKVMPQPHHVAQVLPYLLYSPNAKAQIIYLEPNTLKTAFYEVKYDQFALQDLMDKIVKLHQNIQHNILPDAEAKLGTNGVEEWHCKYCAFKELCDQSPDQSTGMPEGVPINTPPEEDEPNLDLNLEPTSEEILEAIDDVIEFKPVDQQLKDLEEQEADVKLGGTNEDPSIEKAEDAWQRAKRLMREAEEDTEKE